MTAISTRDLIIEKADALFYEGGYEATSFAEIAADLGISRGNFYHHFKAKDEILAAVIARRMAQTRAMLDAWQAEAATPRDRVLCFIRMLITNRANLLAFGCPVGSLCSELAKLNHRAHPGAVAVFDLFHDWLVLQMRAMGPAARAEERALRLLIWSQGVAVIATTYKDEAHIFREAAAMERWLDEAISDTGTSEDPACS